MGRLRNERTGIVAILVAPHRIGRSRANDLVLGDAEVSGEHALIGWDARWQVRDLGSRNGTFVNGELLTPGTRRELTPGDTIAFGSADDRWLVEDTGPPAPWATDGETLLEGHPTLLALPSDDDPQVVVRYDDAEAVWSIDDASVRDGSVVEVEGREWTLRLPEVLAPTRSLTPEGLALQTAALHFRVSRDEEYVELAVELSDGVHHLKPRAHHYLLLTLARARIADRDEGVPEDKAGWRLAEEVERMLRSTKNHIHVGIYRLRRELADLGVVDSEQIVERRRPSQHLRIGVSVLSVETL